MHSEQLLYLTIWIKNSYHFTRKIRMSVFYGVAPQWLEQWFSNFLGWRCTVKHTKIFWRTLCTKLKIYEYMKKIKIMDVINLYANGFLLIFKIYFHHIHGTPCHFLRCTV
jgi:hypothetical protein